MSVPYVPENMLVVPVSLKLLIDMRSNTVVYAEAGKRFVDWLFQMLILPMPLGVFVGLTVIGQANGSLGNLITSIQNLINSHHIVTKHAGFLKSLHAADIKKLRTCSSGHSIVAGSPFCPDCRINVNTTMNHVNSPMVKEGPYIVTDDLVVMPNEDITTLLNRLNLNEVGALEEKVVNLVINKDEAVKLFHAAFNSKKVFTDVFILGLSTFRWFEFLPPQDDEGVPSQNSEGI